MCGATFQLLSRNGSSSCCVPFDLSHSMASGLYLKENGTKYSAYLTRFMVIDLCHSDGGGRDISC